MNDTHSACTPATFTVIDPATLETIAEVRDRTVDEARAAVDRAHAALPGWAGTAPLLRSRVLRRAFDLMLRDKDALAALIARENGKSMRDAAAEVIYAAEFLRRYSEEAMRADGDYDEAPVGGARPVVLRKPAGVVAVVTPWNFPAAMATRSIAPALAAGNTTVLKPASETPLTALAIGRLLREAGLPDGVVEIVPTTAADVVTAWLTDPRVRRVPSTGSTAVGRHLLRMAADHVLNASMELGGNAPLVIAEDADLESAVSGAIIAKFRNGGQACTAANRLYVHVGIAEGFVARLGAEVEKLVVGPAADGSVIGPLISARAVDRLRQIVDRAVEQGARVSHQAELPDAPGYFFPPTVLVDVPHDADVLREEVFGPVAPVVTWTDEDDLLRQVNDTELGLAAYVFAGDLKRAVRLGERIEAGMVGINRGLVSAPAAPFGGVKQSGLGREGAREGLREFQETQLLSMDWTE